MVHECPKCGSFYPSPSYLTLKQRVTYKLKCQSCREKDRKPKPQGQPKPAKVTYVSQTAKPQKQVKPPKPAIDYRNRKLQQKYGITIEDYEKMHDAQSGVCAICKKPQRYRRLYVDHDHATGKVRSLLCNKCNTGLGQFCDNIVLLRTAIAYLEHHQSPQ